ncbi:MAG: UvrD-helicase domain-containing protein [Acidimicrobiales bacterium]
MDPDALLSGLNPAQRDAVTSSHAPLAILAGAGSGKTRVLTRRIAWRAATGDLDPRHVLALTFTRKAAGEMRSRLRQLGLRDQVAAGTFHAVAYAQLRTRWADRDIAPPELLDRKVGFVARLLPSSVNRGSSGSVAALDAVSEIEWAKARMIGPDDYADAARAATRTPSIDLGVVARTYERYEQAKRDRRLVDFDDLLRLCRRDIDQDHEFGEAQRWRFRHLFVDEYQDVNPLQHALLSSWLGDRLDLCVVGDPNQAIYAWNGADAGYLAGFRTTHPTAGVVVLEENYRSSPQILGVANAVLAGAPRRNTGAEGVRRLRANRPEGALPTIDELETDTDEAHAIARNLRDHHPPGATWSSQAVLVRTNAQIGVIEEALKRVGIPFRVRGGVALLDQPEVKTALGQVRRATGRFEDALADVEATLGPTDAEGQGEVEPEGAAGGGRRGGALSPERRANVEAFVRLGHDYLGIDPRPSVPGFLAWLAETTRADQPDVSGDAVEITTFHAAKGLEWPVVHLAGLEQGLVPIGHAKTTAELDEERRLFYVAVTRAERELCLTWARQRTFGSRKARRERSFFLDEVEIACRVLAERGEPDDWGPVLRDRRAALAEHSATPATRGGARKPGTGGKAARSSARAATGRKEAQGRAATAVAAEDQALYEALKAWRSGAAKAGAVPAYVIFHDATLAEIAAARPRSADQLLDVSGVGPVKVGRYGDAVLAVVADHTGDAGADARADGAPRLPDIAG